MCERVCVCVNILRVRDDGILMRLFLHVREETRVIVDDILQGSVEH